MKLSIKLSDNSLLNLNEAQVRGTLHAFPYFADSPGSR